MKHFITITLLLLSANLYALYEPDPATVPPAAVGNSTALIRETTTEPKPGNAKFRAVCKFAKAGTFDPIVHPGENNAGHHHTFFGNTSITSATSGTDLARSGSSTCSGGSLFRSSFWIPSTIDSRNNQFITPFQAIVYYYTFIANKELVKQIPIGLKILPGKQTLRPIDGPNFIISCLSPSRAVGMSSTVTFPSCPIGYIRYSILNFPQCWNGKNLDSPDHRSHMAFGRTGDWRTHPNECPTGFPYRIPEISLLVEFPVGIDGGTQYWRLASDSPDVPAGSTLHGDYFAGINTNIQNTFIQNCIKNAKDCGIGLLGQGFGGLLGPGTDGKLFMLYRQ